MISRRLITAPCKDCAARNSVSPPRQYSSISRIDSWISRRYTPVAVAHSAVASRKIDSRRGPRRLSSVTISTLRPISSSISCFAAMRLNRLRPSSTSTRRSRSLSGPASLLPRSQIPAPSKFRGARRCAVSPRATHQTLRLPQRTTYASSPS